jgi:hypothetical protein
MDDGQEFRKARAKRIDKARMQRGWSRGRLAEEAGYAEKTLFNLLSGRPVKNQTVIDVAQTLCIEPELEDESHYVEVADEQHGEYARRPFQHYEGAFFSYRRSFTIPSQLMRTIIEIKWSEDEECFVFEERAAFRGPRGLIDHSQRGQVYISNLTSLVHFLTIYQGAVRLITVSKMLGGEEIMRGAVLTQRERPMFYSRQSHPSF